MIRALLTMLTIGLLFYGRLPAPALIALCAVLGVALALSTRHNHTQFLTIDVLAQVSHLNRVNPTLKSCMTLTLMLLCVSAQSPLPCLFLAIVMFVLVVVFGRLHAHDYICLLSLPATFLMLGGIALLFEISAEPTGILHVSLFGFWLSVSPDTQLRTMLVMARALGAVSCLYFLSLTTPMSELIGVLRSARCPDVLIELMYLIYRYIFILLSMHHTMRNAAKSRLGYIDYRANLRTTGNLYSNLLARCYRQAGINFDAMESRCYDTQIRFLESPKPVRAPQALAAAGLVILTLCFVVVFR